MCKQKVFTTIVLFLLSVLPGFATDATFGAITSVRNVPNGVELHSTSAAVRIVALSPEVVRVRYVRGATFPADHSFAVLARPDLKQAIAKTRTTANGIDIDTGSLVVHVERASGRIVFLQRDGGVIAGEAKGHPVAWTGTEFRSYWTMPIDEHYFGLGDKAGPMDHRDQAFTMWTTDSYGFQPGSDPLYKAIPFFIASRGGKAYGIFLDNTYRSSFDFGKQSRDYYSFGAESGELNYYFIYGPQPKQVVSLYTALTGRTPLPPRFTMGYQQCRYSYYPESRVREIANEFKTRKIPVDVLYFDIDYQEGYKPFVINRKYFPHFEQLISDLNQQGIKSVVISDLHIKKEAGYKPYDEGMKGDHFIKNPDGTVYVGKVWPGDSVFPDFTDTAARKWYGSLYADFVKWGVRGFWNDMNEPAIFSYPSKTMPLTTVHRVDSETEQRNPAGPERKTDHREIHNVLGMENVRATYEGVLALQPNLRPFVLTRAAFAGTQRYAATWTGDNQATWVHYRLTLPMLLNLGLSGYGFSGNDVGGFEFSPRPELLTRWLELGVFTPMYRNHTATGTRDQEPWVHGPEHEAIRKRYIEERYRLMPYIYTGFEEFSRTGVPVMRPVLLEYPLLGETQGINDQEFFFGRDLLVAPKLMETMDKYAATLPEGKWFDYWTGKPVSEDLEAVSESPNAPKVTRVPLDPALDVLPVYVRAGAIIPQEAVTQNTTEVPQGPLELRVYPGPDCSGSLYWDDGNTFAYKRGEFFRQSFTCEARDGEVVVKLSAPEGTYQPWWSQYRVRVFGATAPKSVIVNGTSTTATFDAAQSAAVVENVPRSTTATEIRVKF